MLAWASDGNCISVPGKGGGVPALALLASTFRRKMSHTQRPDFVGRFTRGCNRVAGTGTKKNSEKRLGGKEIQSNRVPDKEQPDFRRRKVKFTGQLKT